MDNSDSRYRRCIISIDFNPMVERIERQKINARLVLEGCCDNDSMLLLPTGITYTNANYTPVN